MLNLRRGRAAIAGRQAADKGRAALLLAPSKDFDYNQLICEGPNDYILLRNGHRLTKLFRDKYYEYLALSL